MRIALVTHDVLRSDGQGRVNLELAQYLATAGHQVHLYANRVETALLDLPGVVWHRVPLRASRPDLLKCLEFMVRVGLMLRARDYDILHLNGAVALVQHHVNSVHFVHRTWLAGGFAEVPGWRGAYHHLYRRYNAWLEGVVFGRARRVVGVSEPTAGELRRLFDLPGEVITTVPNGRDAPPQPLAPGERDALRAELFPGLAAGELLLGFAGDLRTSRKGIDTVLRAMARLRGRPVRLAVAGSTDGSPYPEMAHSLGVSEQVRFVGFRRDLPRVFQALDCFVFPTRYETFGLVVTEAAAAGCPLLISGPAHCGAAGLFQDGTSAIFLQDPADDVGLAARVEALLDQPRDLARLSQAAQRTVAGWTWEQMGQAYEELYREILAGG